MRQLYHWVADILTQRTNQLKKRLPTGTPLGNKRHLFLLYKEGEGVSIQYLFNIQRRRKFLGESTALWRYRSALKGGPHWIHGALDEMSRDYKPPGNIRKTTLQTSIRI